MTMHFGAGRSEYAALRHRAAHVASRGLFCLAVLVTFFLSAAVLLAGCTSGADSTPSEDISDGSVAEQATTSSESEADESGMDFSYSSRDLDASYNAENATYIRLSDDSVEVQGLGATAVDGTVSVSAAGTYVVSGSIADGRIVVEAGDEDKVQIVLSNASVCSQDGPAISILSADKCFVTLEQDSTNALVDGSAYTLEEGAGEPNAALYCKADLTLNGTGSLSIEGNWQHAVCSKDDLVITGGTYDVSAVEDAFRGKDCVKIADGSFTVDAGGDGFVSTNEEDETRGFVSIDGGTFDISAQDDGIQAYTHARLAGGEFSIDSGDDAVHSDGSASVAGGAYDIVAADDAFHAETTLEVIDGTARVVSCYEGLEAQCVYLRGGTVHVTADDDAVNAASSSADGLFSEAVASSSDPVGEGSLSAADPSSAPAAGASAGAPAGEVDVRGATPESGMAEGGVGMGDSSCVIEISGGYYVLTSGGDTLDSNGSIAIAGGTVLAQGAPNTDDYVLDYDIEATIDGGTLIALGGREMAQNLTSGSQAFGMASVSGSAGKTVAIVDGEGSVLGSFTAVYDFDTVVASVSGMQDGETYGIVAIDSLEGANEDGYASSGTLSGIDAMELVVSTSAQSGLGGLGADGQAAGPGMAGDVRQGPGAQPR